MKIAIDCGHTVAIGSTDGGAEGCGRLEQNLTREVGGLVIAKLQNLGHEVINCTCDDCSDLMESLSYRTNTANNNGAEIFVSIHFNASNGEGHGTEVFTYKGKEIEQARNILNNIVNLGYTNRGIKGESLYVTNHTNMTAMLVECCFIDNENDMSKYNANSFADAIVKGLVGQTVGVGIVQDNQPQTSNSDGYSQTVFDFQRQWNETYGDIYGRISEDGYWGDETEKALSRTLVKKGANNSLVGFIQCRVGAEVDYDFGGITEQCVINYQNNHGLIADGKVAYNTVKCILNQYK